MSRLGDWISRNVFGLDRAGWRRLAAEERRARTDRINAEHCDHPCASCAYLDRLVSISANQWLHEDAADVRVDHLARCRTDYSDSACRRQQSPLVW